MATLFQSCDLCELRWFGPPGSPCPVCELLSYRASDLQSPSEVRRARRRRRWLLEVQHCEALYLELYGEPAPHTDDEEG